MTDYEKFKQILEADFYNPIEDKPQYAERWKNDWETEYLLTDGNILFIFDANGKYLRYRTSW